MGRGQEGVESEKLSFGEHFCDLEYFFMKLGF